MRIALALGCAGLIGSLPARADAGAVAGHSQQPLSLAGAGFSAVPAAAGSPSAFEASTSSVAAGSIATYHWQFGDGSSADSSTPKISHVYATAGPYTATLTEIHTVVISVLDSHVTHQSMAAPVSHPLVVPAPSPVAAPQAVPPPIHISSSPVTIGPRGNAWVWISCPRSARRGCHGTVTIQLAGGLRSRSRERHVHAVASRCARGCRALGSATYQARAGQRIHVRVRMASFVRGLLARQHSLPVRLSVTSVAGRRTALSTATVVLRARRRASH